jgi:methylmalonyl-CoA/ethylmalonyl-CoA epimerase
MKLHHIGIACKDIQKEKERVKHFHDIDEESEVIYDEEQNAHVCILRLQGGDKIELVSGSVVENVLKKQSAAYYHMCYEVYDLDKTIVDLVKRKAFVISEPKPAILFDNRRVAFLHLSYGVIELLESKRLDNLNFTES